MQLLRTIVMEFGLKPPRQYRACYLGTLNAYLLDQVSRGNDCIIIIDEAQDLTMELLEQVRLLPNLETDQHKLLQIILIGHPELRRKLNNPRMRQLHQHITVRYHLDPLAIQEMQLYIQQRMHVAGGNGQLGFIPAALHGIYRYSRGIPRLANTVYDMTLLAGYVTRSRHFPRILVRRAIRELEGQTT